MKIILASASPRRKQLLNKVVDNYDIVPSTCEENSTLTDAKQLVSQLAQDKASDVYINYPDCLVIGCDTVVSLDGQVFGKPADYQQAYSMLSQLSGRVHQVFTGVCILSPSENVSFVGISDVFFRELSHEDKDSYIQTGSCYDKAGAYGVQDSNFVSSIVGSYDNIMGLPTEQLAAVLSKLID